mmetsp:Transcript_61570/g.144288  ORF Transcript_61570/g.144288 Transcript_61570/m.144288 type:complete len:98 (-) Transcript_61570:5-298(-)
MTGASTALCAGDDGADGWSVDFLLDLEIKFALRKARGRNNSARDDRLCDDGEVLVGESGLCSRTPSVSLIIPNDIRLLNHFSAMFARPFSANLGHTA